MPATVLPWRPARRSWHLQVRRNKAAFDGRVALGFGLRAGYWPCLRAPFVQLQFFRWNVSLWHGVRR
jgi:hypothetical protein